MRGITETGPDQIGTHTDIQAGGWVSRLPDAFRPYALLVRLDRPIGVWLLFLPGLWSILLARISPSRTMWLILLFAAGSVLMRGAGCVVNDMWDRDMDRRVTRTAARPLASGALGLGQAAVFLVALLLVSLLILLQLDSPAQALGVLSLLPVAVYPLAKRVTWWPQLMLGVTFGWGAPMGYAAAAGRLDWVAAVLYAAAIAWILGYDTIYAHQDREDDELIGVRSTARLFGHNSRQFVAVCYAAAVALLGLAGWLAGLSLWFAVALAGPGALLAWQVRRLDVNDPALCLALFRANRDVGLAVAAAILIGRL